MYPTDDLPSDMDYDRPAPGEGPDTCKHGNVIYRSGDCEQCEAEEADGESADSHPCSTCGQPAYTFYGDAWLCDDCASAPES